MAALARVHSLRVFSGRQEVCQPRAGRLTFDGSGTLPDAAGSADSADGKVSPVARDAAAAVGRQPSSGDVSKLARATGSGDGPAAFSFPVASPSPPPPPPRVCSASSLEFETIRLGRCCPGGFISFLFILLFSDANVSRTSALLLAESCIVQLDYLLRSGRSGIKALAPCSAAACCTANSAAVQISPV